MKFGPLFKKIMAKYAFKNFSNNKFSLLTYKELYAIAKAMHADGLVGDYTHMTVPELSRSVYEGATKL